MAWHTVISPKEQSQESQLLSLPVCSFWSEPNSHHSAIQIPEFALVHFRHTLAFKILFLLRRGRGVPIYSDECYMEALQSLKNPHRIFRAESHDHIKTESPRVIQVLHFSTPTPAPAPEFLHRLSVLTASAPLSRVLPLQDRRRRKSI